MIKLLNLVTVFSLLAGLSMAPSAVVADHTPQHTVCQSVNQVGPDCEAADKDSLLGPNGLVTKIVQTLTLVVGSIALIMLVIAAIMYATSSGNPERAKTAWQTILYAIIGIIIALLAQLIVAFVLRKVK